MLDRLTGNRYVRWGFIAITVGLCVYALVRYGADAQDAVQSLSPGALIGALVAAILAGGVPVLGWRALLADLGSPLPVPAAMRVFFLSQLGKYLPGSIWPFVAQVEMGREHGVPRTRSATVGVVILLVSLTDAMVIAAIALPFASGDAARSYWWALACAPLLLAVLHPRVLGALLDLVLRVLRRPPMEQRVSGRGILAAAGWLGLGWLFQGLHIYLLAQGLGADAGLRLFAIAMGAFALAWSLGFVAFFAPAGVGVREVVLSVGLAPLLSTGSAVVVVVASRLLLTIADLVWAGLAVLLGRRHVAQVPDEVEAAAELRDGAASD